MLQPQQAWPTATKDGDRLPSLNSVLSIKSQGNRLWLQEVEAATSLQKLKESTPRHPPASVAEWVSVKPLDDLRERRFRTSSSTEWRLVEPDHEAPKCDLPSFWDSFAPAIAAADGSSHGSARLSVAESDRTLMAHSDRLSLRSARSSIAESEYTLRAHSPASTFYASPAVSPTTPYYNFSHQPRPDINVRYEHYEKDVDRINRHLAVKKVRRVSSRATIHSGFEAHSQQQQQCRRESIVKHLRPTTSTPSLKANSLKGNSGGPKRQRHFNQKYQNPDKLFFMYCREDLKMNWPEIKQHRLQNLDILLGKEYDPSVELNRAVNGLNGRYYRENDVMNKLTEDGSGLTFVWDDKSQQWKECVEKQKCRVGENSETGSGKRGAASDPRPRGMVNRYPEEVLEYWEQVQQFVPEERRADVFARATEYTEIRREQRRQHGVPAWTLDNKDERVLNITPKKTDDDVAHPSKGRAPRRKARS